MSQKGFTSVAIIIIVIVILGGLAGYYLISSSNKASINQASISNIDKQSELNSNCEHNDPDLCKFLNQQEINRFYTRKSTNKTTNTDGKPVTFEDIYHYDDKGNSYWLMYRDDKVIQEQLFKGEEHYIKSEDDGWIRITDPTGGVYEPLKDKFKDKSAEAEEEGQQLEPETIKLKYEKVGKESCSNLQCFKYKLIDDSGLSDKTQSSHVEYIWFDDKEYLLRQNQVDDKPDSAIDLFMYEKVDFPEPTPVIKEMTGEQVFR